MASPYVKDSEGYTFIAATQRPDGTWRKPRRVKDGYIPQEEVPLYESKGRQLAKSIPKYPVGFTEEEYKEALARKEKEQKKQQKAGVVNSIPGQPAPTSKKKKKKKTQSDGNTTNTSSSVEKASNPGVFNDNSSPAAQIVSENVENGGWTTVTSRSRNNVNKGTSNNVQDVPTQNKSKKMVKKAETPSEVMTSDPSKRVKNLKKRLREIEALQEKKDSGVKLEKEQLEKLSRRSEVLLEIEFITMKFLNV